MKILDICTVDFSFTGIPVHIRNFYNELKKRNIVDIVAPSFDAKFLETMPLKNNTKLYSLPRKKNPCAYLLGLSRLVKKENYDVIHIHGNSSTMALELFACDSVNALKIVHTHNTEYKAKVLNKLLNGYMLNKADVLFAASMKAGQKLYKNNHFYVINNGIDESFFKYNVQKRAEIRKKYNIKDTQVVIGHVGTFNYQKNQDFLIKIAQKLSCLKYKFILIGDGKREEFKKRIKELNLEDRFIILSTNNHIQDFYSAFDIFAFPSRFEGLGMAAVEAQISGVFCILSDNVPQEARISKRTFFLPLKVENWIKTIKSYHYENQRNDVFSKKYDIHNCAIQLEKIYKENSDNK